MKKSALVLFASFLSVSASAADWVFVSSSIDKTTTSYVDTESISTQGIYKQAFAKIFTEELFFISLNSYDCKSNPNRVKTTYLASYNLDGSVRSSRPTNNSFQPVLPETISKKETDFVCAF